MSVSFQHVGIMPKPFSKKGTFSSYSSSTYTSKPFQEIQFDLFEWYPKFQSCLAYFIDHAQHTGPVQTVAAYVNIKLPYQKAQQAPAPGQTWNRNPSVEQSSSQPEAHQSQIAFLIPYVRRLVATSFDSPTVLNGFFGDEWEAGIGPIHESERRNYLFAAKSDTWLSVKSHYDMEDGQLIPFLRPLQNVTVEEIEAAEANWSEWLAMQDWMLGPRAPTVDATNPGSSARGANARRGRA
jgi:hypothetical protein